MMRIRIYICAVICFIMTACSQIEDMHLASNMETVCTRTAENSIYNSTEEERMQLAEWFASHYTLRDAHRVHNAVSKALSLGLDEVFYLKEYVAQTTSDNKISQEIPSETSIEFFKACGGVKNDEANINSTSSIISASTLGINDYLSFASST